MPVAVLADLVDLTGTRPEPARGAAFLVLLSFLLAFAFIRTSARLMRSPRVPWWPGSIETKGGLHIHHLVWGIALLLVSGFLAFALELREPWWQITAIGFGIGAGLTLDEFALWLHLEDVYWSEEGRSSVDAVIVAAVFGCLVVLGIRPLGLDRPSHTLPVLAFALAAVALAAVAFLKGRTVLGVATIFVPLVGPVAALRLARPGSPWSHRFYEHERPPDRLERSQARFSDEGATPGWRRLQSLIGGAPGEQ